MSDYQEQSLGEPSRDFGEQVQSFGLQTVSAYGNAYLQKRYPVQYDTQWRFRTYWNLLPQPGEIGGTDVQSNFENQERFINRQYDNAAAFIPGGATPIGTYSEIFGGNRIWGQLTGRTPRPNITPPPTIPGTGVTQDWCVLPGNEVDHILIWKDGFFTQNLILTNSITGVESTYPYTVSQPGFKRVFFPWSRQLWRYGNHPGDRFAIPTGVAVEPPDGCNSDYFIVWIEEDRPLDSGIYGYRQIKNCYLKTPVSPISWLVDTIENHQLSYDPIALNIGSGVIPGLEGYVIEGVASSTRDEGIWLTPFFNTLPPPDPEPPVHMLDKSEDDDDMSDCCSCYSIALYINQAKTEILNEIQNATPIDPEVIERIDNHTKKTYQISGGDDWYLENPDEPQVTLEANAAVGAIVPAIGGAIIARGIPALIPIMLAIFGLRGNPLDKVEQIANIVQTILQILNLLNDLFGNGNAGDCDLTPVLEAIAVLEEKVVEIQQLIDIPVVGEYPISVPCDGLPAETSAHFDNDGLAGIRDQINAIHQVITKIRERQCNQPTASIPESWAVKVFHRPQLVVQFAEDSNPPKSARWSMSIPHYRYTEAYRPNIPGYTRGNITCTLELNDNSKCVINASTEGEATYFMNQIKRLINPQYLEGANTRITKRSGHIEQKRVKPVYGKFFSTGQKDMVPDWVIRF